MFCKNLENVETNLKCWRFWKQISKYENMKNSRHFWKQISKSKIVLFFSNIVVSVFFRFHRDFFSQYSDENLFWALLHVHFTHLWFYQSSKMFFSRLSATPSKIINHTFISSILAFLSKTWHKNVTQNVIYWFFIYNCKIYIIFPMFVDWFQNYSIFE